MKELFKANLCMCNNCSLILVDKNPQVGAIEYPVCETDGYLTDTLN